jgi:hypothetical protein
MLIYSPVVLNHFRVMEDAQKSHIHERKSKGQNIDVSNDERKSNGHRSRVELAELV